jgi:FixJ family two-component response regulator
MRRWTVAKVVDGIPKRDAAKQLGISERTLDRKIYDLGITCEQITIPGRRPLVVSGVPYEF